MLKRVRPQVSAHENKKYACLYIIARKKVKNGAYVNRMGLLIDYFRPKRDSWAGTALSSPSLLLGMI